MQLILCVTAQKNQTGDIKVKIVAVMLWVEFCWNDLGPLVPLVGRVITKQYKFLLTDYLYSVMKYFYPDGSGQTGHRGSMNDSMNRPHVGSVPWSIDAVLKIWLCCFLLQLVISLSIRVCLRTLIRS